MNKELQPSPEVIWATHILNKYKITSIDLLFKRVYSAIYSIKTDQGELFLKVNNFKFNYEQHVISYLYSLLPKNNLEILFFNNELNCFITKNKGEELDKVLNSSFNEQLLIDAINKYAELQQKAEVNKLKSFNVRDLSLKSLEKNFYQFINFESDYIKKAIVTQLNNFRPILSQKINDIMSLGIPDMLEHGDFHLGNILYNKPNIVYIDFSEVSISCPLFSLISFQNSIKRRLDVVISEELSKEIEKKYLKSLSTFLGLTYENIFNAYNLSKDIYSIYYVLTLKDLLILSPGEEKWKNRINYELESFLQEFIYYDLNPQQIVEKLNESTILNYSNNELINIKYED